MIPMWEKKLNSCIKIFPTGIGLTLYKGNVEKYKGQAGAELGQAQLKLGLDFNSINMI